jgi:hypothetical protein
MYRHLCGTEFYVLRTDASMDRCSLFRVHDSYVVLRNLTHQVGHEHFLVIHFALLVISCQ